MYEGEDRNRSWLRHATPFYAPAVFEVATRLPARRRLGDRLRARVLEVVAPEVVRLAMHPADSTVRRLVEAALGRGGTLATHLDPAAIEAVVEGARGLGREPLWLVLTVAALCEGLGEERPGCEAPSR